MSNIECKKHYDKEFLLQLQYQPMSLCKPKNLPDLPVIRNKIRKAKKKKDIKKQDESKEIGKNGASFDITENNWVPIREENNAKKVNQIQREAVRETRELQQVYKNMTNYPKNVFDHRDGRKNTGCIDPSEDSWSPSSKNSKGSYCLVDPSKLKLTKPDKVESIRLGPGVSGRGLTSWGRGSSGGTKTTADSDKTARTNRPSASYF